MFWKWFSRTRNYRPESLISERVRELLSASGMTATLWDTAYQMLDATDMRDLVYEYHNPSQLAYSSSGFPDCDDFARLCVADILRGAIKEGFKQPLAFGILTYTRKSTNGRHMACVGITKPGNVWVYEPQRKMWLEPTFEISDKTAAEAEI